MTARRDVSTTPTLPVDHLVWGGQDLEAEIARLERLTGVRAAAGGQHRGEGTWNALLRLGPASYLELIAPACAWTAGVWQLGPYQRKWNDVQNTPRDVQMIADHLLSAYRRALKHRTGRGQDRRRAASA